MIKNSLNEDDLMSSRNLCFWAKMIRIIYIQGNITFPDIKWGLLDIHNMDL